MANPNLYRILGSAFCAALLILTVASAPAQKKTQTVIGAYTLNNYGVIEYNTLANGDFAVTITSTGNVPMQITSPSYDLTAPRIEMTFAGKRAKATRVIATGGVKVVNRDTVNSRKTIITCNETRYSSTVDPKDNGVLRLQGNIRSEVQGLQSAAGPIVATGDTGTVQFLEKGAISVVLKSNNSNGTIQGQFYEPEQKPKGNQ